MHIRSLISSAAVVGTLLASSALVGEALAQKGTVMSPSTSWAVSKVDNAAGPYCAMARQFNQNTVLTIARNENSETSFALDFQNPVFGAPGQASIILDPGAGQQRAYKSTPVSNKAFVVRMGRDSSFFSALERTGLLRVEVNGNSYHFNVSDIDSGEAKLAACIVNMVMPAAGEDEAATPLPSTTTAASQAAPSNFRQEINALRRELARLTEKNESLMTQLETRQEGGNEASASVSKLSAQIQSLEDQNATLKKQLDLARAADVNTGDQVDNPELAALRQENLRLKAELQTAKPQDDVVVSLEAEIESLKNRNADLQNAVQAQNEGQDIVDSLRARIASLETENSKLNAEVRSASASVDNQLQEQIANLSQENADLKSNMDKKGVDAGLLDQLRSQIAQAENENRLLRETAEQSRENMQAQMMEQNVAEIQALKDAHAEHIATLETRISDLEGESANKDQEMLALSAQDGGAGGLVELETLKAEHAARVAKFEAQLAELEAKNKKQAQDLLDIGSESSAVQALREDNEVLAKKVAALETERSQAETLLVRVEELQEENEALQNELTSAPSGGADVSETVTALEADNQRLEKALEEATASQEQLAALEADLETLRAENASLQSQLASSTVEDDLKNALAENAELLAQIEEKDRQLLALDALKTELAALEERTQNSTALESDIAALEAQRDEMKKALADVVEVAERFKAKSIEQEQTISALEGQNESLKLALEESAQEEVTEIAVNEASDSEAAPQEEEIVTSIPVATAPQAVPAERAEEPRQPVQVVKTVPVPTPAKKPAYTAPATEVAQISDGADLSAENSLDATRDNLDRMMEEVVAEVGAPNTGANVETSQASLDLPSEDLSAMPEAQRQEYLLKQRREQAAQYNEALVAGLNNNADIQDAPVEQLPLEEAKEPIVMSQNTDPFDGMRVEGEDKVAAAEPEVIKPVVQQDPETIRQPSQGFSVKDVITAANISTPEKIKPVASQGNFDVAYQWNGGSIYGSAEQKPLASPEQFDELVQEYLERTQSRCPGDFAVVPDNTVGGGNVRADSYEVACVSSNVSSGASLLFFNKGGDFAVVAHEAPTEELDTAMSMRNKIMQVVTQGS